MMGGADIVVNQMTIGDVIVAVMDAAMASVHDEELSAEIASRVVVNILEKASPGGAKAILAAFGDQQLH